MWDKSCGYAPFALSRYFRWTCYLSPPKTGKQISLHLQLFAVDILRKYYQEDYTPNDYIFPVLKRNVYITAIQQYDRVKRVTRLINHYLKVIENISTSRFPSQPIYRDTPPQPFSTVLNRSGVSTTIISESLGHSSKKITQIYLDSSISRRLLFSLSSNYPTCASGDRLGYVICLTLMYANPVSKVFFTTPLPSNNRCSATFLGIQPLLFVASLECDSVENSSLRFSNSAQNFSSSL